MATGAVVAVDGVGVVVGVVVVGVAVVVVDVEVVDVEVVGVVVVVFGNTAVVVLNWHTPHVC